MPGSPVRSAVPVPAEGGTGAGRSHGPAGLAKDWTSKQQYKLCLFSTNVHMLHVHLHPKLITQMKAVSYGLP